MYSSRQMVLSSSDTTADVDFLMIRAKDMPASIRIIVNDLDKTYGGTLGGSRKMRKLCKSTVIYSSL